MRMMAADRPFSSSSVPSTTFLTSANADSKSMAALTGAAMAIPSPATPTACPQSSPAAALCPAIFACTASKRSACALA
ncbi:hypothetical protein R76727_04054 [Ralstonia mannitolilytica]|nr:hypothetical protein R76727_04054 [Ralstonia mannitolilytica]